MLPLKSHIVPAAFLLIKFEHVGAQAEFPENAVAELLKLPKHLVLLLLLLYAYAGGKGTEGPFDGRELRGSQERQQCGVV